MSAVDFRQFCQHLRASEGAAIFGHCQGGLLGTPPRKPAFTAPFGGHSLSVQLCMDQVGSAPHTEDAPRPPIGQSGRTPIPESWADSLLGRRVTQSVLTSETCPFFQTRPLTAGPLSRSHEYAHMNALEGGSSEKLQATQNRIIGYA